MSIPTDRSLPPGQHLRTDFPRFGLGKFAHRFPEDLETIAITLGGDIAREQVLGADLQKLERVNHVADFHCVTTWSVRNVAWSGWRFRDVYEQIIVPSAQPQADAKLVVLRGSDEYCSALPLKDLLADHVLLADRLNDAPLGIAHGAPIRLMAPAHYGYKNCKHLCAIEFWRDSRHYRFPRPYPKLMDHPRGRAAFEERARWLPAPIVRWFYRLLVPSTVRNFKRAMEKHLGKNGRVQ